VAVVIDAQMTSYSEFPAFAKVQQNMAGLKDEALAEWIGKQNRLCEGDKKLIDDAVREIDENMDRVQVMRILGLPDDTKDVDLAKALAFDMQQELDADINLDKRLGQLAIKELSAMSTTDLFNEARSLAVHEAEMSKAKALIVLSERKNAYLARIAAAIIEMRKRE
jgi:hypothetical protein